MAKKYWTTESGVRIEYKDITDSHLVNILSYIKRKAKEGVEVVIGGGMDWEGDPWGDIVWYEGKEVERMFDYRGLHAEAKRRGLLDKKGGFS